MLRLRNKGHPEDAHYFEKTYQEILSVFSFLMSNNTIKNNPGSYGCKDGRQRRRYLSEKLQMIYNGANYSDCGTY